MNEAVSFQLSAFSYQLSSFSLVSKSLFLCSVFCVQYSVFCTLCSVFCALQLRRHDLPVQLFLNLADRVFDGFIGFDNVVFSPKFCIGES